jgi:tetratricopeptide (TPR) repeat protein/transcriptional regulator with XRE-family HTH domain
MSRAPRRIDPNESVRHLFAWTLRETRTQAGFGLQGFAKRLGKSDSYLSAVELAEARCTREFAEVCDRLLDTGGRLMNLWVHADAAWSDLTHKRTSAGRSNPHLEPEQPNQEVRIVQAAGGEDLGADAMVMWCVNGKVYAMPTRRELLKLLGAGAVIGTVGSTVERLGLPPAGSRVLDAMRVFQASTPSLGSGDLQQLEQTVEHYATVFRRSLPETLYPELLGIRLHVGELLNGSVTLAQHRDLLVTAGWLSNLLGLLCFDLGDPAAAGAWCTDVEKRADDATHPELAAWASQTRVLMAFYGGKPREAIAHAQEGQAFAPLGTVAHAKLVAQEMRAWAQLGDGREVADARRRAEQAITKLPAATPTQGAFSISRAGDPPYTATSLLLLGQFQEAEAMTRQVITSHYGVGGRNGPGEHPAGFALAHLRLALALAGLGQLDEAHDAANMALAAPRPVRSVVVLASEFDRTLTRAFGNTAQARDFHERFVTTVRRTPPAPSASGVSPS